jgi:hypothetical protein
MDNLHHGLGSDTRGACEIDSSAGAMAAEVQENGAVTGADAHDVAPLQIMVQTGLEVATCQHQGLAKKLPGFRGVGHGS